jgi:hypothetical protein
MRRLSLALALLLLPQAAWAAACTHTWTVKDGAGASQTFCRGDDGTGNFIAGLTVFDSTGANQLGINSSGQAAIQAPPTLPLPAGAATQTTLASILTAIGTPMQASGGSVTANAGTNLNTSLLALEAGGNLAGVKTDADTLAAGVSSSVYQENLKQVNGVTTLTGAGATGTGAQRETVAQDTTTIAGSAPGTAGTASANVVSVQGIASMTALKVDGSGVTQPVSGTVTANAGTNLNTSALALDATVGTTNTDIGPPGATACSTDTGSCSLNAFMQRLAQRLTTINTTLGSPFQAGAALAANQSVNVAQIAGTTITLDPCQTNAKTYTPFSLASTTALKLVAKTSAKNTFVCAFHIIAPNNSVALIEGTKTTNDCDTATAGVSGGTTAATGWLFNNATAPGVGLQIGNGGDTVAQTATTNHDLCLLASATTQISGGVEWVQN